MQKEEVTSLNIGRADLKLEALTLKMKPAESKSQKECLRRKTGSNPGKLQSKQDNYIDTLE